ncbi:MAG: histidinol-phosphate transaminase [Acidimicrobiales bacterium]
MAVGRVRPAVTGLASYRPGKGASQAEAEHGIRNAIKLASNENPYEPVDAVRAAIIAAAATVNRYGDHRASELRSAIANWLAVDSEQVTVGCGSVGLLQQLCLTYVDPGDEVVFPWPSFEAYPINVRLMGGVVVAVDLIDNRFDLDAVAAAVTDKTKIVMLATPNNPTGTAVRTDAIKAMIEKIPDDVIVLVDEAYREFVSPEFGDPVADLVPHHRNLIVTRTFSKAYGLAGLRSGYAVGDPEVISEIDKALIPFAVNSIAQAATLAALGALDEIQSRVDAILRERARMVAALQEAGWDLPDAQANFVYIPVGERTDAVAPELEKQGVVIRPFSGEGIRVTVGTVEENDRFLKTFGSLTAS